ncbi:DUF3987 domain-containing protein [Citreicella sp. C3M06]|nr:DUF3987 domain-containing protein [Citreicella sp. C3M06]
MSPDDFGGVYGPWASWLTTAAEVKGAPVDYVALGLLTTASAAIGNSRWFSPWNGWTEPPVLWAMLVGDPSAGKSPALDAVADPVKDIERALSQQYQSAWQTWKDKDEIASLALLQWKVEAKRALADGQEPPAKPTGADAGAPPVRERLTITDATTEKVAELLAQTWRGLLMSRDELSGWLASMDRYSGGGDRPFWLEAYGGRSYPVDRKSSPEPIIVDHLTVAVLGGTQPDKLARLLVNTDDDGLLARFLTVFPDPVPLSRPAAQIDTAMVRVALERLRSLGAARDDAGAKSPFYIVFSEAAADALQDFRKQCRDWETEASGLLKGHIGKMPGMAVRVAGVLAHLDWAVEARAPYPDKIGVGHIARACHLVGGHLRLHAFRAYGAASPPDDIRNARRIADVIRSEDWQNFTARDIQRRGLAGLQLAKAVQAALDVLEQADWVMRFREETGGKPRVVYVVNPRTRAA